MLPATTAPQNGAQDNYAFSLSTNQPVKHIDYFQSLQNEWDAIFVPAKDKVIGEIELQLKQSILTLDIAIRKTGESIWQGTKTDAEIQQLEARKDRFIKVRDRIEKDLTAIEYGTL